MFGKILSRPDIRVAEHEDGTINGVSSDDQEKLNDLFLFLSEDDQTGLHVICTLDKSEVPIPLVYRC